MNPTELAGFALIGPLLARLLQPLMQRLPSAARPVVLVVVTVVGGILDGMSKGMPWMVGAGHGLAAAGTAALHHDVNLKGE